MFDSDRYIKNMCNIFLSENSEAPSSGGALCRFRHMIGYTKDDLRIWVETMVPPSLGRCWIITYLRDTNPLATELWLDLTGDAFSRQLQEILNRIWVIFRYFCYHLIQKHQGWTKPVGFNSSAATTLVQDVIPKEMQ